MSSSLILAQTPEFVNFEDLQTYSHIAYNTVLNILALGFAVMAGAFVYFLATSGNISPRWRITSTISAVVMVSAFLELFLLWFDWQTVFAFADGVYQRDVEGGNTFSNGYRYMNWSIDVPMLTLQLLIMLGYFGVRLLKTWGPIAVAGLVMIWTGYIGQFYEVENIPAFLIWGAVSTVFYIYFLYAVLRAITESIPSLPGKAATFAKITWWWFPIFWTFYPIAYVIPAFWVSEWAVVARQLIFTSADITTKVIFGIFLTQMALSRSRAEDGFQMAYDVQREPEEELAPSGWRRRDEQNEEAER